MKRSADAPADAPQRIRGDEDPGRETTAELDDRWLDDALTPTTPVYGRTTRLLLGTLAPPARAIRRILSFALTTPGKLFSVTVLLTLAIGAAGFSLSQSSADRKADLDVLLSTTEPMSNASHNLYTSLSLADTVASTGFVQGGVESRQTREKYTKAMDTAAVANSEALLGSSREDERIRELTIEISRKLPTYTGLVESARTNNRQGHAVAAAYMSNASMTMRTDILPAAAELFGLTGAKVAYQQDRLTDPQWVPLSGLLAALALLLGAQWWLWRLTRRKLNRGFVTATCLLLVALSWVGLSNVVAWVSSSRGFDSAAQPWDMLTNSRIEAQQARTSETLALVNRESANQSADSFSEVSENVRAALEAYESSSAIDVAAHPEKQVPITKAHHAIDDWDTAHQNFLAALERGDYKEATRITSTTAQPPGTDPTAAASFAKLDSAMADLIGDSRTTMRDFIGRGIQAMSLVSVAVMVLSVLAILAVWLGIRPRLQEYL
ncbi:hypothetical protein [Corynebacterium incognita]|uniref:hypothetical protein n=1 Tax=Corynebacterium incognita TaxID=2754725 RepID=UPI001FED14AB|nr:hypothetical protein [Corynebacterium incognita]